MNHLDQKIEGLPLLPGCYIFKNSKNTIIYIGKSKSLKKRVKQYFTGIDGKKGKMIPLVREIYDIDYIVTATDLDAMLLECKLIKSHKPRYNSQLKQSPGYFYIKIVKDADYPTISITNKREKNGELFGFFKGYNDAFEIILLFNSICKTPVCNQSFFSPKKQACLHYHMRKCLGPCEKKIAESDYKEIISEVIRCLQGKSQKTSRRLKKEMLAASEEMNFEKAAAIRNHMNELDRLKKKSRRLSINYEEQDLYVFLRSYHENSFSLFFIRNHITLHRVNFETIHDINEMTLIPFIEDIKSGHFVIDKEENLTVCVHEIYCDKIYVSANRNISPERLVKKLIKACNFREDMI